MKIIIDTDPGCDDMLAIVLMASAPLVDILAVTTVAGNVPIQKTTNNARHILDFIGKGDVTVYSGYAQPLRRDVSYASIHGTSGLGDVVVADQVILDGTAVDQIIRLVQENPGEATLLMLGPQTNIAKALQKAPEIMKLTKAFVMMGGAFNVPGNHNGAEFNMGFDPDASSIVSRFPVPKTYIPLDLCNTIQVPLGEFNRIEDKRIRTMITTAVAPYIENIQKNELPTKGALMYDVLAAYYLLRPNLFTVRTSSILVDESRGATTECLGEEMVTIAVEVPENSFVNDFIGSINQREIAN